MPMSLPWSLENPNSILVNFPGIAQWGTLHNRYNRRRCGLVTHALMSRGRQFQFLYLCCLRPTSPPCTYH